MSKPTIQDKLEVLILNLVKDNRSIDKSRLQRKITTKQENKLHAIQLAKMDKAKAKYNQTKQAKDLFEWGETIHESFINRLKGLY